MPRRKTRKSKTFDNLKRWHKVYVLEQIPLSLNDQVRKTGYTDCRCCGTVLDKFALTWKVSEGKVVNTATLSQRKTICVATFDNEYHCLTKQNGIIFAKKSEAMKEMKHRNGRLAK